MKPFTEHPNSVGESYFQHMQVSFGFGIRMFTASLGCFLHGLFPFLCTTTGSTTINKLHRKMVTHRCETAEPSGAEALDDMPKTRRA